MVEINRPTITVVALKGSTSQRFVENLASNAKLVTAKDYDTAVKMVLEDKSKFQYSLLLIVID